MNTSESTGRTIAGVVLIALGATFLLAQVTDMNIFGLAWPLFVLVPGGIFLAIALRAEDEESVKMIFPGVIVTGTGLILAYQNTTNHWESWAYIWALYPVFAGVAMRYLAHHTQDAEMRQNGRRTTLIGLLMFVVFGAMFELFIFNGVGLGVIAPLIPLLMIGAGVFMLLRNAGSSRKSKRKAQDY